MHRITNWLEVSYLTRDVLCLSPDKTITFQTRKLLVTEILIPPQDWPRRSSTTKTAIWPATCALSYWNANKRCPTGCTRCPTIATRTACRASRGNPAAAAVPWTLEPATPVCREAAWDATRRAADPPVTIRTAAVTVSDTYCVRPIDACLPRVFPFSYRFSHPLGRKGVLFP